MEGPTDPLMFLGWVVLISASGVIAPGPLFATAVARGIDDPRAGLKISLGHAIVEMPLILTIFLGLMAFLQDENIWQASGWWRYLPVLHRRIHVAAQAGDIEEIPVTAPNVRHSITAANPYFLMWWATAVPLIGLAAGFGWWMMLADHRGPLSCDFAYLGLVSYSVSKGRSLLQGRWLRVIYVACGYSSYCSIISCTVRSIRSLP